MSINFSNRQFSIFEPGCSFSEISRCKSTGSLVEVNYLFDREVVASRDNKSFLSKLGDRVWERKSLARSSHVTLNTPLVITRRDVESRDWFAWNIEPRARVRGDGPDGISFHQHACGDIAVSSDLDWTYNQMIRTWSRVFISEEIESSEVDEEYKVSHRFVERLLETSLSLLECLIRGAGEQREADFLMDSFESYTGQTRHGRCVISAAELNLMLFIDFLLGFSRLVDTEQRVLARRSVILEEIIRCSPGVSSSFVRTHVAKFIE